MCQLLALSSHAPTDLNSWFATFAARGGRTGDHVDGFGLALHDGTACRLFTDTQRASESPLAAWLQHEPLQTRLALAHIRKATQGNVAAANCHPFVREWLGRSWSFCHNGNLRDFNPRLDGSVLPLGATDSERAFCWILQELRRRFRGVAAPAVAQLAPVIADLAERIARHGTFNFLLADGETLYAHATTHLHLLAHGADEPRVLVATDPLTTDAAWVRFAAGELRVFVAGTQVWQRMPAARRTRQRSALRTTSLRPDHTASTAHTLTSTKPSGSASSRTVSSVTSEGSLAAFFGHDTHTIASGPSVARSVASV